jgi:hypothetical protein
VTALQELTDAHTLAQSSNVEFSIIAMSDPSIWIGSNGPNLQFVPSLSFLGVVPSKQNPYFGQFQPAPVVFGVVLLGQ